MNDPQGPPPPQAASDPEMTADEKNALANDIARLNATALTDVVDIIRTGQPPIAAVAGADIEIDIHTLPSVVLWRIREYIDDNDGSRAFRSIADALNNDEISEAMAKHSALSASIQLNGARLYFVELIGAADELAPPWDPPNACSFARRMWAVTLEPMFRARLLRIGEAVGEMLDRTLLHALADDPARQRALLDHFWDLSLIHI